MAQGTRDLTSGPVWRGLAVMTGPMMLGILATILTGLTDAFFLGRLGGAPLAAVGFIYPVTMAITSLSIGLSAGANAAVSQAIGRRDDETATARVGLHAVLYGTALATLVTLVFWVGHRWLFGLLGAGDDVLPEISAYLPWWCLSFPFVVAMMLSNALFRAHGNAKVAMVVMTTVAILNIALTPALIFGVWIIPALETAGAGMATFIARALGGVVALWWAFRQGLLSLASKPWKDMWYSARVLAEVGAPAAFSNAINPAGMAAVTAAVAVVSEAAVGGFGAATRIQSLALVPLLALSAGIGPVVGQNWGAGRQDRAARGFQAAAAFCIGYGLLVGAVLYTFAGQLGPLVAGGSEPGEFAATYLRVVGLSLFGYGILVVANAAMNARSRALWSMGLSLGRIFLIYIPGAWLGVTLADYLGITIAAALANVAAAAAAVWAAWMVGLLRPGTLRKTFD